MQWLRHLLERRRPQIPDALWRDCLARLPFLQRLPESDLVRLKALSETLLADKSITGAADFPLTDEVAVSIAAQACLVVLNLTLDLYDDMAGIIVYPSAFIVRQREMDEAGVVHEWHEPLAGEAIQAGGAVVLSWEDVESGEWPDADHNVVIHEFAHKIDMAGGDPNGRPPFLAKFHRNLDLQLWQQVFSAAYADFTARVDSLDRQLPDDFDFDEWEHADYYDALYGSLPIDPYAAKHPAEFFAVASEAFFVKPAPLAEDYPEVYRLLAAYYRQDPLQTQA
jgi:Mlc titration factor MtfA (ptsG expression regulator)